MHFKVRILHFGHANMDLVIILSHAALEIQAVWGTGHTKLGQRGVLALALLTPDMACQLDILGLQCHTAAVKGNEVGIL